MHLGIILKPLAKLIADDDATVRKGIIAFLEWLLPSVAYVRLRLLRRDVASDAP
jgi:hypothetical protein